jgi:hypothetical protein
MAREERSLVGYSSMDGKSLVVFLNYGQRGMRSNLGRVTHESYRQGLARDLWGLEFQVYPVD